MAGEAPGALALADILPKELAEISEEIRSLGRRVLASAVDVTSSKDVLAFVAEVEKTFGRVDVAVNNAAVRHYGYAQEEFLLMSLHVLTKDAQPIEIERAFRSDAKSFDAGEWRHRKRNGDDPGPRHSERRNHPGNHCNGPIVSARNRR